MILDHKVRTYYENLITKGQQFLAADNFYAARSNFEHAYTIAKSFDDLSETERCSHLIKSLEEREVEVLTK